MSLRVIAGKAKGLRLKPVPGDTTRPVMDRVKEALFSILDAEVPDSAWLDLFAGTGSVGIEALSRGAARAVFVERARAAVQTIHDNLDHTKLADDAEVMRSDVFDFLGHEPSETFDVVYIAPPQYKGLWQDALHKLDANTGWLNPDAIVVVQIDPKEQEALTLTHLEAYEERTYGNTLLWFFEYPGE